MLSGRQQQQQSFNDSYTALILEDFYSFDDDGLVGHVTGSISVIYT
jgi:hypothetical protein